MGIFHATTGLVLETTSAAQPTPVRNLLLVFTTYYLAMGHPELPACTIIVNLNDNAEINTEKAYINVRN